jgi:hypothetical protein
MHMLVTVGFGEASGLIPETRVQFAQETATLGRVIWLGVDATETYGTE